MLIGIFCNAQTIRIECENMVEDDQFTKSQSILPIYKYVSDSIEPYSKFGLEIDKDQAWYKIKKLPDMTDVHDTGYTYIYFAGSDNERSQGYILCLIGNYERSYRDVIFYVDRNNDLDFTNDGNPDTLGFEQNDFVLTMRNAKIEEATYSIKLSRFKYGENVRYKHLLEEHYKQHSGSKIFTQVNYCYREQRYNSIVANYKTDTDSFTIGIKDVNVNGLYNEPGLDVWYIGPYGSTINSDKLLELSKKSSENTFEWNGKKYQIDVISLIGAYITIHELKGAELENALRLGKSTPNFTYFNILNNEHQLSEFKKKQVYLFFWDIASLSDEDTTYLGKIHREYSEQLQLITLNHGDEPKKVRIAFHYDKISFPVAYSNSTIGELYYIEDLSRGYYLDKKCRLLDDKISPKEMYLRLQAK